MKIKVDGDLITIEGASECKKCKKFCEGIVDESISQGQEQEQGQERKVSTTTYRKKNIGKRNSGIYRSMIAIFTFLELMNRPISLESK